MAKAREDVLSFCQFLPQNWKKINSTNLLERISEEIKRRFRINSNLANETAIERLVGLVLLEQDEQWLLEEQRLIPAEGIAKIPALADLPSHTCLQEPTI